MKTFAIAAAALLTGCLAATAQATTTKAQAEAYEVVSYADLNLANEADAAILLERVEAAARRVCVRSGVMLGLDIYNPVQQCAHDATARAMQNVKSRSTGSAIVRL